MNSILFLLKYLLELLRIIWYVISCYSDSASRVCYSIGCHLVLNSIRSLAIRYKKYRLLAWVLWTYWLTSSIQVSSYLLIGDDYSIFLRDFDLKVSLWGFCLLRIWKGITLVIFWSKFSFIRGFEGIWLSNRRNELPKLHFYNYRYVSISSGVF